MSLPGFGTKIAYHNAQTSSPAYTGSTGWTDLATIVSIDPAQRKSGPIDTTHMLTAGGVKTFIPGIVEPGEMSFTVQYDKTANTTIAGLFNVAKSFRIVFSDLSGEGFEGFISSEGKKTELAGLVTQDLTVTVSGPVTAFTDVTGS